MASALRRASAGLAGRLAPLTAGPAGPLLPPPGAAATKGNPKPHPRRARRAVAAAAAVTTTSVVALFGLPGFGGSGPAAAVRDRTIADFDGRDIDGNAVDFADFLGQVVLCVNVASD